MNGFRMNNVNEQANPYLAIGQKEVNIYKVKKIYQEVEGILLDIVIDGGGQTRITGVGLERALTVVKILGETFVLDVRYRKGERTIWISLIRSKKKEEVASKVG